MERSLFVPISTEKDSLSPRVHAWRGLRRLGAHNLQQSVCATYFGGEESEAGLRRLQSWLASVDARYVAADGHVDAAECEPALADFEAEALAHKPPAAAPNEPAQPCGPRPFQTKDGA